jgi:hypothetical protein
LNGLWIGAWSLKTLYRQVKFDVMTMRTQKISFLSLILILLSSVAVTLMSDRPMVMGDGSALSHPMVRIVDHNGGPIEDATVIVLANGTLYAEATTSSGWAVFQSFDGGTFPPGSTYSATKDGYRTIEWSQGDPIPPMVISRKDDTVLVILLIALTVISALILLAFSFKGRPKKGRDS